VSQPLAEALAGLIGAEARVLIGSVAVGAPMQTSDDLDWWEHRIESVVEADTRIAPTEREAIIRASQGQGIFKQRVMAIEERCRITGVANTVHLIASHCKPWRDSDNEERLNGDQHDRQYEHVSPHWRGDCRVAERGVAEVDRGSHNQEGNSDPAMP
jgi:hypothetical protein